MMQALTSFIGSDMLLLEGTEHHPSLHWCAAPVKSAGAAIYFPPPRGRLGMTQPYICTTVNGVLVLTARVPGGRYLHGVGDGDPQWASDFAFTALLRHFWLVLRHFLRCA